MLHTTEWQSIEDLRETQVALEQERDRYRQMFDYAPVAQLVFADTTAIVEANVAAGVLFGVEAHRLRGQSLSRHLSEADADALYLHIRAAASAQSQPLRVSLLDEDGSPTAVVMYTSMASPRHGEQHVYQSILVSEAPPTAPRLPVERARDAPEVLVVDDEPKILTLVRRVLEHDGYRVAVASSSAEALAILHRRGSRLQLLLTDIDLPDLGGPGLAEVARKARPDLRLLFMSGGANSGESLPATLLRKPFKSSDLRREVRLAIEADA